MVRLSSPHHSWASLTLAAAVGAASFSAPSVAEACSTVLEKTWVGYPGDGSVDVPTDVVLTVDYHQLAGTEVDDLTAVLTSSTGQTIGVHVELSHPTSETAYPSTEKLTPEAALEPNTVYTLGLSWTTEVGPGSWEIRFTTGAGPYIGTPAPPTGAFLQHYRIELRDPTSCSPHPQGTCVALPEGLEVETRYISELGKDVSANLRRGSHWTNLTGIEQGTPYDCVELRTRAPNGALSEPVVLCGDEAEFVELTEESQVVCTAEGIPMPAEESAGCRMGQAGGSPGRLAFLAIVVLLHRVRRRRS